MATKRSQGSAALRLGVAGVAVVAIAIGVWLSLGDGLGAPEGPAASEKPPPPSFPEGEAPVAPPPVAGAPAPAYSIGENARLTVPLGELREGEVLALGLDMPDEARGLAPRKVQVVDVDRGRVLEVQGEAIEGAGSGLRIEMEPDWVQAGRYLIQVRTAEPTHLPVRRYVLELFELAPESAEAPEPTEEP